LPQDDRGAAVARLALVDAMHKAAWMMTRMVAVLTAILVAGAAAAGVENLTAGEGAAPHQQLPSADIVPEAPASAPSPPSAPSLQSGGGLSACRAWTDGCVICRRAAGPITCSNIGIACQPQVPRCLEAAPAEAK
jgi:hypothetical protein